MVSDLRNTLTDLFHFKVKTIPTEVKQLFKDTIKQVQLGNCYWYNAGSPQVTGSHQVPCVH